MITFTRSLPLNPGHSHSSTRLNTPRLAHLGCSGKKSGRDRRLAACENCRTISAGPPGTAQSLHLLALPQHPGGTLPPQNPIVARGAPGRATSRDFVPWRFSDAGRRSAW
jgi:hypothetical protein